MTSVEFDAVFDEPSSTLVLSGDLDDLATPALRDALDEATARHTRSLTVSVAAVTFLPSSAVGVLASSMRRLEDAGHQLKLVAVDGSIAAAVLRIVGLPYEQITDRPTTSR